MHELIEALRAQPGNQMVAGAIALGVVLASLRKIPALLWSQLKRGVIVTATLDSRNDLFPAFVAWLNDQRFSKHSRLFTVVQAHRRWPKISPRWTTRRACNTARRRAFICSGTKGA